MVCCCQSYGDSSTSLSWIWLKLGEPSSENLIFSHHTMHKFGFTQSKFLPSCRNCSMEALGDKGRSDAWLSCIGTTPINPLRSSFCHSSCSTNCTLHTKMPPPSIHSIATVYVHNKKSIYKCKDLHMVRATPPVHCIVHFGWSQNMPVLLSKMVLAQHFSTGSWGWKKAQQSLTPAVDWLNDLIGPGGLLLVVSHLLQSHFQFYGWGWE